ncbi:DUF1330 domain-containing protein [Spirosoma sp.]|uniref:DUF1330 domain-containing protein n=1 Tax=Spirosoma sp. TaxID=1899569 RepID=UPI003B3B9235
MLYYTQLIFVKEGQEAVFQSFEEKVLPLLESHHGELLLRVRPSDSSIIAATFDKPYEIHLVSFRSREDFETYRDDPQRIQHMHLKDQSVSRMILIEGKAL